ncbi:hypothetical protein SPRG_05987 [Saprolegnia parasitica CBS 223.65]|uniref:START domain-containing protein n=1 Tax=Saprolegnia parasitica (strain CBS 223.65) TaxID=695850 RepID=A0A067CFA6_SAPPC|nr:hypothetical protein SPRG_05987 [Saprolegnia parasitica CBS 223.65]KDO29449.1 hypothetical protein SPRG_05987 [Saprolegnia parasitica CBS 223.65]|eukprot:XP_012199948.1 hypothetical protein SPRG_05987 [Saprolegnia parasitica CBS 223.65]
MEPSVEPAAYCTAMRTRSLSTKATPALPPAIENMDDFLFDLPSINKMLVSSESTSSSDETIKADASVGPYSRQHRYRQRQKDERKFLRDQVESLSAQLEALRDAKPPENVSSEWETVARSQKAYAHQATLENARLKRALEDQLRLAGSLQQILSKRPRLMRFPTMDSTRRRLRTMPIDQAMREAAFHTLMDDTYAQVESILRTKGLATAPDGHQSITLDTTSSNETIGIDCMGVRIMASDYIASAQKCWAIWCEPETRPHLPNVQIDIKILDRFGPDATYFQDLGSCGQDKPYMVMLSGMKRFYERDVIVMKTFLEDEAYPPPPDMFIGDHTALFVLERLDDGTCRRRSCLLGCLPIQSVEIAQFADQPPMMVCDYVLHHTREVSKALESFMS